MAKSHIVTRETDTGVTRKPETILPDQAALLPEQRFSVVKVPAADTTCMQCIGECPVRRPKNHSCFVPPVPERI